MVATAQMGVAQSARSLSRRRATVALAAALAAVALTVADPLLKQIVDLPLAAALNRPARMYPWLDYGLHLFDGFPSMQGLVLMSLLCGALLEVRRPSEALLLVTGLFTASFAAVVSRLAQHFLPAHPRPMYDAALSFLPPLGADPHALHDRTSFPSDHAALLWGLACALSLVRPRLSVFAFGWVALLGFARAYGGYHYLTDTLAGWLLGTAAVFGGAALPLERLEPALAWAWRRRLLAGGALFFAAVQSAQLFDDLRGMAKFLIHAVRGDAGL